MAGETEVPGGAGESGRGGSGASRSSQDERERWAAIRRDEARRRRRRRILFGVLLVVLALGVAGWVAKPMLKEMAVESGACDGALPEGALDALRERYPDRRLTEEDSRTDHRLGRYSCEVKDEKDEPVLAVDAYTGRDEVDTELGRFFPARGGDPGAALPAGLPGAESRAGEVVLTPPCPGIGKDAAGQPGRLLVHVHNTRPDEPHRMLRAGTAVANKAAAKLGCRARPLQVPAENASPETVSPAKTEGTPCAALARGPLQGAAWTVEVRAPKGTGPMVSCAVRPSGTEGDGDAKPAVVELRALYGDWVRPMMLREARVKGTWAGPDRRTRAWLLPEAGWASARCDGRAAAFELSVARESGNGDRGETVSEKTFTPKEMRRTLAAFAESQSRKRGCQDLSLPPAGR